MSELRPTSVLISGDMKMPVIGIGTWMSAPEELEAAITCAIEAGYRHIDTAYMYCNEAVIGSTLKKMFDTGVIKREDIFITTKLPLCGNRPEHVEMFIKRSLEALQLDYVDLYLIHNAVGVVFREGTLFPVDENGELEVDMEVNHVELWKTMEEQVDAGRTRSIGVSNFSIEQLNRIVENCRIRPANIQVELHIYFQQKELFSYCKENDIVLCAYAPLGSPKLEFYTELYGAPTDGMLVLVPLDDPVIAEIAKKHNKLPAQVMLRYLIQYGVSVIPKSTNSERIKQNIDIFDFELSDEEFEVIKALDRGEDGRMFAEKGMFALMKKSPDYPFPK